MSLTYPHRRYEEPVFAAIAERAGVPSSAIVKETASKNTTDNFVNSKLILDGMGFRPTSAVVVTKPYMKRRALAVAEKQWPDVRWFLESPELSFLDYPTSDVPLDRMISLIVGDLQRLKVYAERGFQTEQDIPDEIWRAYDHLVSAGFDEFVIR